MTCNVHVLQQWTRCLLTTLQVADIIQQVKLLTSSSKLCCCEATDSTLAPLQFLTSNAKAAQPKAKLANACHKPMLKTNQF